MPDGQGVVDGLVDLHANSPPLCGAPLQQPLQYLLCLQMFESMQAPQVSPHELPGAFQQTPAQAHDKTFASHRFIPCPSSETLGGELSAAASSSCKLSLIDTARQPCDRITTG